MKFNRKLLNHLITLPAVLADNLHDKNAVADHKFAKGCSYMLRCQYVKAIQCYLAMQKLEGVAESLVSETLTSSSGSLG